METFVSLFEGYSLGRALGLAGPQLWSLNPVDSRVLGLFGAFCIAETGLTLMCLVLLDSF